MKEQITPQKRKYIKERLSGKSKRQAALDAGYTAYTAHNAYTIETPAVKAMLQAAMRRAGITDDLLAKRMRDGLDATEPRSVRNGKKIEVRDVVAWAERREMVKLIGTFNDTLVEKVELGVSSELVDRLNAGRARIAAARAATAVDKTDNAERIDNGTNGTRRLG